MCHSDQKEKETFVPLSPADQKRVDEFVAAVRRREWAKVSEIARRNNPGEQIEYSEELPHGEVRDN